MLFRDLKKGDMFYFLPHTDTYYTVEEVTDGGVLSKMQSGITINFLRDDVVTRLRLCEMQHLVDLVKEACDGGGETNS